MIYTFYSYKGGVGRSMALANIAERFHENGLRVILVDWDLEAPGLETFFISPSHERQLVEMRARPGLIDMLTEYKTAFPQFSSTPSVPPSALSAVIAGETTPSGQELQRQHDYASELTRKVLKDAGFPEFLAERDDGKTPPAGGTLEDFLKELYRLPSPRSDLPPKLAESPFAQYLQSIHPSDKDRENGVYLLSAGARAENDFGRYAAAVQEFDWSGFYAAYQGHRYFTWFRECLRSIADVVLIDSRTGVTEMGGVCTRHIADVVVSFCAPNFQNVDGVVRVVSGINKDEVRRQRGERAVEVMVIPTRIDTSESDRLKEFSETFAQKVEAGPDGGFVPAPLRDFDRPLWDLQIPYIARYNYREERVIGPGTESPGPVTQKLIDAYRKIALHLAVLAPEQAPIRKAFAGEIRAAFPHLSNEKPQMAPPVPEGWVERMREAEMLKNELLARTSSPQVSRLVVYGGAGTGKTTLVASVCRDPAVIAAYPDGVLWLNADRYWSESAAAEWLRNVLGLSRRSGAPGVRQALSGRRFLLVVDDVWKYEDVWDLLKLFRQGTQVLITRDLQISTAVDAAAVVAVGALTNDQALKILGTDTFPDFGPTDPDADPKRRYDALAQQLFRWPLGASLLRKALDRSRVQGASLEKALEEQREAFLRHEILAFDLLAFDKHDAPDRNTSIGLSLNATLSRLSPEEDSVLIRIAKSPDGVRLDDVEPSQGRDSIGRRYARQLQRLANLGLIEQQAGHAQVHPLIRDYLLVEGRLDESVDVRSRHARISSSAEKEANDDVRRAQAIIRGAGAGFSEIKELAEALKDQRYFTFARLLFARARQHPEARRQSPAALLKLIQRQALCTYRDPDLPAADRFGDALSLLEEGDLNDAKPSAETLGLAGALCKYRWKLTGYRGDLERSVAYYGSGADRGVVHDHGYTGINAAFVLDLLAQQESQNARPQKKAPVQPTSQSPLTPPEVAKPAASEMPTEEGDSRRHADRARSIRERIIAELPPLLAQKSQEWLKREWWFLATLAEACFGLGRDDKVRFSEARYWLREALALGPPAWQLESTARQLVALAVSQSLDLSPGSEAHRVLRVILGDAVEAIRAVTIGKVGLALSGGGFRASLFHIGVLARMAELDMLRHVEVLSCVSGGSIVGAHYYLEVRRLLQEKPDGQISRADYIEIVRRVEREFLAATQKNLRMRLFAGWWANLRTIFQPAYTRTVYLGSLFERHIYSRVRDGHNKGRRWLNELQIRPNGDPNDFNPKVDNWRRAAKAPILLLNATTLNTGHNWQFAVSWMGEPPLGASSPVDRNDILRRMYYWEAPQPHTRIALGQAVAASACVPFLFDPIELKNLYPGRSVRLVDGGAHDNQGIVGLLEQECTVLLVSDASGQTGSLDHPSGESAAVALRTNNILMARVREAEFRELELLRQSSALGGLVYLHLKQDLEANQIDWIDCQDPHELLDGTSRPRSTPLTSYGMLRPVQARLAAIRTDLDSFTDAEAYALMLSGYRMATARFKQCLPHWPFEDEVHESWNFLAIEDVASRASGKEPEHAALVRQLTAGADRGFKGWRLAPGRTLARAAISAAVVIGLALMLPLDGRWTQIGLLALALGLDAVAFGFVAWLMHSLFRTRKSVTVIATGVLVVTIGWLVARVHLALFDGLYLQQGKVRQPAEPARKQTRAKRGAGGSRPKAA